MISHGRVILTAGAIAGVCDITAAILSAMSRGRTPTWLLQAVAGGVLGTATFSGGTGSAALGLLLHFVIATCWAAAYYVASRKWSALITHALPIGMLYGVFVHLAMSQVIVPLSKLGRGPFSWKPFLTMTLIHIVCVGLPIALTVRHFARSGVTGAPLGR